MPTTRALIIRLFVLAESIVQPAGDSTLGQCSAALVLINQKRAHDMRGFRELKKVSTGVIHLRRRQEAAKRTIAFE
jgi:hypothetical protein